MSQSGAQITSPAFAKPAEGGRPVKILAFGDSPTRMTGFARVMRNVLQRWWETAVETTAEPAGGTPALHCWGIGFEGWPHDLPYRIFPGGTHDWNSAPRLSQFLKVLADGQYTHVFMLMDPDALSVHGFPQKLRQICKARGIRVLLYYPVDAPLEREWLGILDAADVAVSYTEYGREETRRALGKSQYPIEVVPHGVDECFAPMSVEDRAKARVIEFELQVTPASRRRFNFVEDDTFLMLGVNKNEWRKDPLRMLEILLGLRRLDVPAKLLLRMDPMSAMGGIHLELAAKQLGLTYGKEWCHIGPVADELLAGLYNAADLYLTTSLGEGWGLGVTEAMACHTPVAMPRHTSLDEIGAEPRPGIEAGGSAGPIWLPMETGWVCGADTRLRHRVGLQGAIQRIYEAREHGKCGGGARNALAPGRLKTWDAVAATLFGLLMGTDAADTGANWPGGVIPGERGNQ